MKRIGLALLAAVAVGCLGNSQRAVAHHDGNHGKHGKPVAKQVVKRAVWAKRHDQGWKKAKYDRYGKVRYVTVRQKRAFILRPAREDRFVVRRRDVIVIRPVPYWSVPYRPAVATVAVKTSNVQVDLAFRDRKTLYGCGFCDGYFQTYPVWKRHVNACSHGPKVRIVCEPWDEDDADYFCEPAASVCAQYDDDWDDWGREGASKNN